jgi:hypothetical protein
MFHEPLFWPSDGLYQHVGLSWSISVHITINHLLKDVSSICPDWLLGLKNAATASNTSRNHRSSDDRSRNRHHASRGRLRRHSARFGPPGSGQGRAASRAFDMASNDCVVFSRRILWVYSNRMLGVHADSIYHLSGSFYHLLSASMSYV